MSAGHVRCDKPIRGRHVRLEKAPYPFVDKRPRGFQKDFSQLQLQLQLQLCELQVWGNYQFRWSGTEVGVSVVTRTRCSCVNCKCGVTISPALEVESV